MNKELQIDDLTRGINDDGPVFNETERREPEVQSSEAREQDTALPGDKCWQDFLSYLEAPTDLADSLDDCDIRGRCRSDLVNAIVRSFFENHLSRLAQYRREKKSLFNNYKPESHA